MAITAALPRVNERRVVLPTVAITALTAWLAWRGWLALQGYGPLRSIHDGQVELAGPVVLGFVLVVFLIEQLVPAERHKVFARGHVLDVGYLIAHAVVVVPVIILIGSGFSSSLARLAPWLVLPRNDAIPRWCYVALAVVAIDAVDWLAHLANHKLTSLWRLHAVHHSQEELSILSTFRTHPLVHVSFVISAVPVLAFAANGATPAAILTAYACLGALPHANVRWTYGRLGTLLVSPAYHRLHHSPTGRLDINLGTVLTVWDRLSRRAIDPSAERIGTPTGLSGRPIPVEQAGERPRLLHTFVQQWVQPFVTNQGVPS
ncbi:MAG TPA: sterol desaturase family protein [Mycobacteriales bacterium]|nr:sterol desaturase family protein [Mycobacteriales bacterium]